MGQPFNPLAREKVIRPMRLYDKVFDQLFPATAHGFNTSLSATTLWNGAADDATRDRLWYRALCADVLLIRAASYRQPEDLFTRPRFWSDLLEFFVYNEGEMMARSKQQTKQGDRPEWKGFLERRLTEQELGELDEWKPKPTDVFNAIDGMMADDFRLTLSYNKRTRLATCTIIDDSPSRKTRGWALSTADENAAAALKAAVFKHTLCLDNSWDGLLELPPRAQRG